MKKSDYTSTKIETDGLNQKLLQCLRKKPYEFKKSNKCTRPYDDLLMPRINVDS